MTNADRIRNMNDFHLAKFMHEQQQIAFGEGLKKATFASYRKDAPNSFVFWLQWLKEEAEGETE